MDGTEAVIENLSQELKRGTVVLAVLLCTDAPVYGYALVNTLCESGIAIEQNTLYPLLRRLESQMLLQSSWVVSESRPRRYYAITQEGLTVRAQLLDQWIKMGRAVAGLSGKENEKGKK